MDISVEILMILLLIAINGVLAMAEFAIVAARKGRLQDLARQGDRKAIAALELGENPADFLSTVQIGITLVGIFAGAFGGATIASALEEQIAPVTFLAPYAKALSVVIVVVVITMLTLVFGELAPKRFALNRPESLAAMFALPMKRLARLAAPLVRFLSGSTDLVLRMLGIETPEDLPITEEEIRIMITQATEAGVFHPEEQDLMVGVLRLGDRRVGALITPRTDIDWLDLDDPIDVNLRKIAASRHSKFPVGQGSLDNVIGVVAAKKLLDCLLDGNQPRMETCMTEPVFVPENTAAISVLEIFKTAEPQLVIVIDEYGGVQGLLTIRDILEAIVGDLPAQNRAGEGQIYRRADQSWLVDGMLPVDEFMEAFQIEEMADYDRGHFETLGGFVMSQMGKIPTTGEIFEWGGYSFEIVDMDGLRVDKVLIKIPGSAPGSAENQ